MIFRVMIVAGVIALSASGYALEASGGQNSIQTDTRAIAMSMDAKNAAVMAILQKITTCNAIGAFYRPGLADSDPSNGCWSASNSAVEVESRIFSAGASRNETLAIPGTWQACALIEQYASKTHYLYCSMTQSSIGRWTLVADDQWRVGGKCSAVCINVK